MAQAALQKLKAADNEVERFYALATESEAALLLADPTRCRKKLVAADRLLADDVTRRSRTRLQLRTLYRQLGHDPSLIDALRVPPLVLLQSGPDADRCANIVLPPLLLRLVKARALLHVSLISPFTLRLCEQLVVHRSEEHTSELQSLMRISYAVFCLKKKKQNK